MVYGLSLGLQGFESQGGCLVGCRVQGQGWGFGLPHEILVAEWIHFTLFGDNITHYKTKKRMNSATKRFIASQHPRLCICLPPGAPRPTPKTGIDKVVQTFGAGVGEHQAFCGTTWVRVALAPGLGPFALDTAQPILPRAMKTRSDARKPLNAISPKP